MKLRGCQKHVFVDICQMQSGKRRIMDRRRIFHVHANTILTKLLNLCHQLIFCLSFSQIIKEIEESKSIKKIKRFLEAQRTFQGFATLLNIFFHVTRYLKSSKHKSSVIINLNTSYSSPLKCTRTNSNNLANVTFNYRPKMTFAVSMACYGIEIRRFQWGQLAGQRQYYDCKSESLAPDPVLTPGAVTTDPSPLLGKVLGSEEAPGHLHLVAL